MNGWTPLHYAAHSDDQVVIRELLDRGADKMALTADGRTPRDLAIKWAVKKLFYSRPEYEIEYERWYGGGREWCAAAASSQRFHFRLYPEKYDAEQKALQEADRRKWEEIQVGEGFVG